LSLTTITDEKSIYVFTFGVAGINTLVRSNNGKLVSALQKRYEAYACRGDILLHVTINYVGQKRSSSLLDTGTRFKDGICHFTAEGYEGFIDSSNGKGELFLSSKRPIEEVDYFLRVAYAILSFDTGGLMFHAAGIVRENFAHLFFGHSGAGKTTVARVSKDDVVLNDDLLILIPTSTKESQFSKWFAYATPFWNPTQVAPSNQYAPVIGLYRLVQDQEVYLEHIGPSQALAEVVSNVPVIPDDPSRIKILLQRGSKLVAELPVKLLHFLPDDSFWQVVNAGSRPDKVVS
jgi:hypothetical protein